jgi:hypothetical protein
MYFTALRIYTLTNPVEVSRSLDNLPARPDKAIMTVKARCKCKVSNCLINKFHWLIQLLLRTWKFKGKQSGCVKGGNIVWNRRFSGTGDLKRCPSRKSLRPIVMQYRRKTTTLWGTHAYEVNVRTQLSGSAYKCNRWLNIILKWNSCRKERYIYNPMSA